MRLITHDHVGGHVQRHGGQGLENLGALPHNVTMTAAEKLPFTAHDFLSWEPLQPTKHEYVQGETFAMAGAGDAHVTISGNVFAALKQHLRGSPCRTYIADMKVRAQAVDAFFYPDVFVTCSPADAQRNDAKEEPLLVVEVLSPTTVAYDRGLKFEYYRTLPSLQEYVLIDPERHSVEVFRRNDAGLWVLFPFGADATPVLASVELTLPMAVVYEDVG
jgi:Uma2 family endonuclease